MSWSSPPQMLGTQCRRPGSHAVDRRSGSLVAEREEAINLADARAHPRFKLFPEVAEEEYRAFLAAPIIYQKQLLGVIVVQQPSARQFSEGEEAFLMTLAAQLAMAIRGLKQKASVKEDQLQILFQGTPAPMVSPLPMLWCWAGRYHWSSRIKPQQISPMSLSASRQQSSVAVTP